MLAVLTVAGVVAARWLTRSPLVDRLRPAPVRAAAQVALPIDCADNPIGPNGHDPNRQVFWGELHLHTGYSLDAFSFGTRTTPAEAYLFAKGLGDIELDKGRLPTEPAPPEPLVARPTPLDFVAITDHSEFLSVVQGCADTTSPYWDEPACHEVRSRDPQTQAGIFNQMADLVEQLCETRTANDRDRLECLAQQRSAWLEIQRAAQTANNKCHFTSFVAYEWSDQDPVRNGAATNHRNVIFANANVPRVPLSAADYIDPPELWTGLDRRCTGPCRVVTIPHNTNLSAGVSLRVWDLSARGLRQQKQYQVAAEIYQHKGASECHSDPAMGFDEPECAFEQLDKERVDEHGQPIPQVAVTERSFLRWGLGRGLAASLLTPDLNVFKLGFVGGTDGHNGAPGNVDENTWRGHDAGRDDTPFKRLTDRWDWGPGGITAVWAEENSRESIFAAIERRETYATSGPRIKVRVLRTTNSAACTDPGYPGSVLATATPMGGTFRRGNLGGAVAPTFIIEAWPDSSRPQSLVSPVDPGGVADIAAVQVIKIHAHATRGGPVTTTDDPVDVIASDPTSNFDSAAGGCLTWTDQDFNPNEAALYYVRVLQEPTWRWTYHDCLAVAGTPEGIASGFDSARCVTDPRNSVQERAWTSPIWYEPVGLIGRGFPRN
jgi:hypothetical protein